MNLATVTGPTPPGTGVIAPAFFAASSKATSPTRRLLPSPFSGAGMRLMPTSMTVAPGFPQSPFTISGRPTAATRMSASAATRARSFVREWQIVTVAFRCRSSSAIGFPTMSLRPMTTARAPAIATPDRSSSSMMPAGVHDTSDPRFWTR